mmetsp:Transcript_12974/g.30780  ORF Transcript_12974/g.30780 Transcript_12974/m.30780 type:complete len:329 (-) Transcript_12974:2020-3006(-)
MAGDSAAPSGPPTATLRKTKHHARQYARQLISRFAGVHAKTANQTKWILDLIAEVDSHYRKEIDVLTSRAESAEGELRRVTQTSEAAYQQAQHRTDVLHDRVWHAEQRAIVAEARWAQAEAELSHMQDCLRSAAAAAAAGSAECCKLQLAFSELSQAERRQMKAVNAGAVEAKQRLNAARGELRENRHRAMQQALEIDRAHSEGQRRLEEQSRRTAEAEEAAKAYKKASRSLERKVASLAQQLKHAPAFGGRRPAPGPQARAPAKAPAAAPAEQSLTGSFSGLEGLREAGDASTVDATPRPQEPPRAEPRDRDGFVGADYIPGRYRSA